MPHTKEMRTLPIPEGRLLIVPGETLPEDANDYFIDRLFRGGALLYYRGDLPFPYYIDLPPGSWSLLGKASELTEEQIKIFIRPEKTFGWPSFRQIPDVLINGMVQPNNPTPPS